LILDVRDIRVSEEPPLLSLRIRWHMVPAFHWSFALTDQFPAGVQHQANSQQNMADYA
jgi:hypothetical protein